MSGAFEQFTDKANQAHLDGDTAAFKHNFLKSLLLSQMTRLAAEDPEDRPTFFGLIAGTSCYFGVSPLDLEVEDQLNRRILVAAQELIVEGHLLALPPEQTIDPDHVLYPLVRQVALPEPATAAA